MDEKETPLESFSVEDVDADAGQLVEHSQGTDEVPCEFLCGPAGTGKTFEILRRIRENPSYGYLTASTGIAAVNLNATTIHSLLGFFDTADLKDKFYSGRLVAKLRDLSANLKRIVLDEVSMLDGDALDIIYLAVRHVNLNFNSTPLGLFLVGDFAQLPPIKAKWAFEAACWPEFAKNMTRLTKIWRQEQAEFLTALGALRRGDGETGAAMLNSVGVQWHTSLMEHFDGTTIVAKNDQVDFYNQSELLRLKTKTFHLHSARWGQQSADWKRVPLTLALKPEAYVMILANRKEEGDPFEPKPYEQFEYVNGDCGHVVEYDPDGSGRLLIRLIRNDRVVSLRPVTRSAAFRHKPDGWPHDAIKGRAEPMEYIPQCHQDSNGKYVTGQVLYYPLRLAYASTVHKSQGLSLDRIQVDIRNHFFASPAMAYVALSRCRTLDGLRIIGQQERLVKHCNADKKVREWL